MPSGYIQPEVKKAKINRGIEILNQCRSDNCCDDEMVWKIHDAMRQFKTQAQHHNLDNFLDKTLEGDHWIWTGKISKAGQIRLYIGGKKVTARRTIYEMYKEKLNSIQVLEPNCGYHLCMNPNHQTIIRTDERARLYHKKHSHCKRGHPMIEGNIIINGDGSRRCKTCRNQQKVNNYHSNKKQPF